MKREQNETMSLTEALRDGTSPEEIRKSFEAALQEAQNEVAAEQAANEPAEDEIDEELEEAREDMIVAVIDYLYALGIIPEDVEVDDSDIENLSSLIRDVEQEYKAGLGFMKMLSDMAKMQGVGKTWLCLWCV